MKSGDCIGGSWDGLEGGLKSDYFVIQTPPQIHHEAALKWKGFADVPKDVRLETYHWKIFRCAGALSNSWPSVIGLWIHEDLVEKTEFLLRLAQSLFKKQ